MFESPTEQQTDWNETHDAKRCVNGTKTKWIPTKGKIIILSMYQDRSRCNQCAWNELETPIWIYVDLMCVSNFSLFFFIRRTNNTTRIKRTRMGEWRTRTITWANFIELVDNICVGGNAISTNERKCVVSMHVTSIESNKIWCQTECSAWFECGRQKLFRHFGRIFFLSSRFDLLLLSFQKPLCSGIMRNKYIDGGRQKHTQPEKGREIERELSKCNGCR